MANEISAITGNRNGNSFDLIMIFPIPNPKQVNGSNVVPTPRSQLSSLEQSVVPSGHLDDLDAGTSVFRKVSLRILDTDTGGTLANKARTQYAAMSGDIVDAYNKTYKYTGQTLDKV